LVKVFRLLFVFSTLGSKGGYFFFLAPPPPGDGGGGGQKYGQITGRGEKLLKGAPHSYNKNFSWGKNINQEGGGGKNMNFKFNIHPCIHKQ